jgi:hypothetical protein
MALTGTVDAVTIVTIDPARELVNTIDVSVIKPPRVLPVRCARASVLGLRRCNERPRLSESERSTFMIVWVVVTLGASELAAIAKCLETGSAANVVRPTTASRTATLPRLRHAVLAAGTRFGGITILGLVGIVTATDAAKTSLAGQATETAGTAIVPIIENVLAFNAATTPSRRVGTTP